MSGQGERVLTYKFRLYLSGEYEEKLEHDPELSWLTHNHFLEELNERNGIPSMSELQRELPELKEGKEELQGVRSKVHQMVLKRPGQMKSL